MREASTKALASRIKLDYANKPSPFRFRLRLMSWGLPMLALAYMIVHAKFKPDWLYEPGPVSAQHAIFGKECALCHTTWSEVRDKSCVDCHEAPMHHGGIKDLREPRCADCHREHRGMTALVDMKDRHCVQCHGDLKKSHPTTKLADGIRHFTNGHPEFGLIREKRPDSTPIVFNHKMHVRPERTAQEKIAEDLKAAGRTNTELTCVDCHRPDSSGRYMASINYEQHCGYCHTHQLVFDDKDFAGEQVPHRAPPVVHNFLMTRVGEFAVEQANKPAPTASPSPAAGGDDDWDDDRGGAKKEEPEKIEATIPWVTERSGKIENMLFARNPQACLKCHKFEQKAGAKADDPLYKKTAVAPPHIPNHWFTNSVFDHRAHRTLTCAVCHGPAEGSEKATDLLLPGIKTCQECHRQEGGARADCVRCHAYHKKEAETGAQGQYQLIGSWKSNP